MLIHNLINELFKPFKCINCNFGCYENTVTGHLYFYDKTCCPKDYPLSIWLRYNAGWKTKRIKR